MANKLWQRWKRLAHRAAEIQALILLTIVYWIVVAPIGAALKLGGRRRRGDPAWTTRPAAGTVTLEEARRQS